MTDDFNSIHETDHAASGDAQRDDAEITSELGILFRVARQRGGHMDVALRQKIAEHVKKRRLLGVSWGEILPHFGVTRQALNNLINRPLRPERKLCPPRPEYVPEPAYSQEQVTELRAKVLELYDFDPETGVFARRRGWAQGQPIQTTFANGYIQLAVGKGRYRGHRVAWLLHYGVWPDRYIDHINRVRTDNRIANLRLTDSALNCLNAARVGSSSGFKGIRFNRKTGLWDVTIKVRGVSHYASRFPDPASAARAYDRLALKHAGEFACTNEMLGLLPPIEAGRAA